MRSKIGVYVLAVAPLVLTSCDFEDFGDSDRYREDFHKTFEVQPGGRLSVDNSNGSVEITGWEKSTVDITGTKYASTEASMRNITIDIVQSGNNISIRTVRPSSYRGNMGAKYIIRVPARYELDRIVSSNGSIHVDSITGNARLKTSNGSLHSTRLVGRLDAETSNGSVEVTDQDGDTVLRTSNGRIRVDGVKGFFEAHTSNGSVNARITDPRPNAPVKVETSNGSIDLTLANLRDNSIRANTSNSSITVHLPSNLNANLRAHTSNSNIQSDFDLMVKGGASSKHTLEGTVGSGGPTIDLETNNGSIRILRM